MRSYIPVMRRDATTYGTAEPHNWGRFSECKSARNRRLRRSHFSGVRSPGCRSGPERCGRWSASAAAAFRLLAA